MTSCRLSISLTRQINDKFYLLHQSLLAKGRDVPITSSASKLTKSLLLANSRYSLFSSADQSSLKAPQLLLLANKNHHSSADVKRRTMATTNSAKFTPVTHVIFDVDGLLIDSEKYYSEAVGIVCKKYGKEFTWKIKSEMMGTKPLEGAIICLKHLSLMDKLKPEDFVAQYQVEMKRLSPQIALMPGARRLIEHLNKNSVPIAIATGASQSQFEMKTSHLGEIMRKPFSHHVFAGSDPEVKNGKPSPDVFLEAAKRFSQQPKSSQNVLVFEDAINGVKAAVAAGMQVILVPDKRTDLLNLDKKPTQILESLEQFKPELFGLAPFDK